MDLKEIVENSRNMIDFALDDDYWRILVNVAFNLWLL